MAELSDWAPDEVLSVVNGQGKHWYQADALGSIYTLTTASGEVRARGGYDVFGAPVAESGAAVGQPFGFTGREHELDSALVYSRARYLNPATGAWTTSDPFSLGEWIRSGESSGPFTRGQETGLNVASGESLVWESRLLNHYAAYSNNPTTFVDPSGESALCLVEGVAVGFVLLSARRYDSASASLLAMITRIARLAAQSAIPELIVTVTMFVMMMEYVTSAPGKTYAPIGEKFKPDCVTSLKLLGDLCRASPPERKTACWLKYAYLAFVRLFRPDKW